MPQANWSRDRSVQPDGLPGPVRQPPAADQAAAGFFEGVDLCTLTWLEFAAEFYNLSSVF